MSLRRHCKQQETNTGVKVLNQAKVHRVQALLCAFDDASAETQRLFVMTESELRLTIGGKDKRAINSVLGGDRGELALGQIVTPLRNQQFKRFAQQQKRDRWPTVRGEQLARLKVAFHRDKVAFRQLRNRGKTHEFLWI